jgi:small subunit ribosomal protein S2
MAEISLADLLKSGAHFGHKTSRWNPKMKPYIFTVRNDVHILDLEKTKKHLLKAASYVADVAKAGGVVLFVGTKRQARSIIKAKAEACGMPYVNVRWLGGTFTNFKTIQKTIRKMEKLMELKASGQLESRYTKKERLLIEREIVKMERLFEGMKDLKKLPTAILVEDINHDDIAVTEARASGVTVIGLTDSNSNPDLADYAIPCNDDATQAIDLVFGYLSDTIKASKSAVPAAITAPQEQVAA